MHNTLIVAESTAILQAAGFDAISFTAYLNDYPLRNEGKTRVINLCATERYLSQGYYCSLLAEARHHKVLPSVNAINDLRLAAVEIAGLNDTERTELAEQVRRWSARLPLPVALQLNNHEPELGTQSFYVLFGQVDHPALSELAAQAFRRFPCPVLELSWPKSTAAGYVDCRAIGFDQLPKAQHARFIKRLQHYIGQAWRHSASSKRMQWDMAILVNPDEPTPPSDEKALKRFAEAARKEGFQVDITSRLSPRDVAQYDALFIRETTAIDHHTYRLARAAEREGLVVIDDSQSILRCCNKVYLQDAFSYHNVPAPSSQFVYQADDANCDRLIAQLGLPIVLKLPESSFSRGVYKVENRDELQQRLSEMLSLSALVLAQEYIFTEFDWRIGILDGRPIYACKYFMARNHWQIYNHEGSSIQSGGFLTLPTFEVPKQVLQAATKAAKAVGNSLYGVDLKQQGKKVYVIEVNDNPSIDAGVEDDYLGSALYQHIMATFAARLRSAGR